MEKIMVEILGRLTEINSMIAAKKKVAEVSLEDVLKIEHFFHDYEKVNPLIDALERMAHQDIKGLHEYGEKLKGLVDNFMSLDLSVWEMVDFDALMKRKKQTNNPHFSYFKITYLQLLIFHFSNIANALSKDLESL